MDPPLDLRASLRSPVGCRAFFGYVMCNRPCTYKQNFSFHTGLSVFSLTDVVLMNLAGMRSTAVFITSLLADSSLLADDTIPSMQYGSLNPKINSYTMHVIYTQKRPHGCELGEQRWAMGKGVPVHS